MQVPVKIKVKSRTEFEIDVGTPPTSALILKEVGLEKGSGDRSILGNLTMKQVVKIAGIKRKNLLAKTLKSSVCEVVGTCGSMGITVEGMSSKEAQEALHGDRFDQDLEEPKV
jgi:large subunit ribosomal protein L11